MDLAQYGINNIINSISLPYYNGTSSSPIASGGVSLGVADKDVLKILLHGTAITEGGIKSLHVRDNSTSYQNTSGSDAVAVLNISANAAGTSARHVKIFSSPSDDSITSATLILDIDQSGILDANGEILTVLCPNIQNNHYLVIQNVDESRAGDNSISVQPTSISYVVERG